MAANKALKSPERNDQKLTNPCHVESSIIVTIIDYYSGKITNQKLDQMYDDKIIL